MMKLIVAVLLVAAANACRDRRSDCSFMRPFCYIPTYKTYMTTWCSRTCGFCGGPATHLPPPTQFPPPNTNQPPSGSCGKPQIAHSRVIAGTTATRGSWPWQILMLYNGRAGCGGTIISPTWVITAAHCVDGKEGYASSFTVRVGEHDRNSQEGTESDIRVARVFKHPSYARRTLNNDIALFKLSKPIAFTKYVQPACLPSRDAPVGTSCYITGWGKTRHPGSMTSVLQQAQLSVVSNSVCERYNKKEIPIPITSAMVCAGDAGLTQKSGCHGDSGGPFVCNIGGRWEIHGAVSHGSRECKSTSTYTVFARVNYFKSWIKNNMARYGA